MRLDQRIVSKVAIETADPRSKHFRAMRHQDIVPEHIFGRRLELLTLAVLGQLEAEATGTGSPASGSTASSRSPSWAARRRSSTRAAEG